ncbi:hypothetical protein PO909_021118 [Leuciscus waleckii]
MQARMFPARIESILTMGSGIKLGQAITVKQFQRLLGLMAVASNIIPLGLLHMRPLQWWLKAKGFFPQGESVPYNKGYVQMPSFPINMEESLVLVPRASIKGVMSPENRFDRRFHHWLGRGYRPLCQGSVAGPSSFLAYKLPRNFGCVQGSEELPPRHQWLPRLDTFGQYISGSVSEPTRGTQIAPSIQIGASNYFMVPRENIIYKSNICPGGSESGSRHPVEAGAEARGMETPSRGGGADMAEVWTSGSGAVCVSRDVPLSTLVLPHSSSPAGVGCHGTGLAEASPVRFPPDRFAPGSPGEGPLGGHQSSSGSPVLAGPSMVFGLNFTPDSSAMADSSEEGSVVSGGGQYIPSPPRAVEIMGLASEGAQYLDAVLSIGVHGTILISRVPSTRRLYDLKWKCFSAWYREHELGSVGCPVASVLSFSKIVLYESLPVHMYGAHGCHCGVPCTTEYWAFWGGTNWSYYFSLQNLDSSDHDSDSGSEDAHDGGGITQNLDSSDHDSDSGSEDTHDGGGITQNLDSSDSGSEDTHDGGGITQNLDSSDHDSDSGSEDAHDGGGITQNLDSSDHDSDSGSEDTHDGGGITQNLDSSDSGSEDTHDGGGITQNLDSSDSGSEDTHDGGGITQNLDQDSSDNRSENAHDVVDITCLCLSWALDLLYFAITEPAHRP